MTTESRTWKHARPFKVAHVIEEARKAEVIVITASDYAWLTPFDLHLFLSSTTEEVMDRFMTDYGEEWRFVDFPWVVSHVDLIDNCNTY